jgi:hypothetical protein
MLTPWPLAFTPCRACQSPCRCHRSRAARDPEFHLHPLDLVGLLPEHLSRQRVPGRCARPRLERWPAHPALRSISPAQIRLSTSNAHRLHYLSHQWAPRFRLPGPRHSLPRPLVRLPINQHPRQLVRGRRRSAFDRRRPSAAWLKLSLTGPCAKPSMLSANLQALKRQHAAWRPIALGRLTLPMISPTLLKPGSLSRDKKFRRSRLTPAPRFHPLLHLPSLRRSPSLAREKLSHLSPHIHKTYNQTPYSPHNPPLLYPSLLYYPLSTI